MSGGTEGAVLPEYTVLIDTARIARATEALETVCRAYEAEADACTKARSDLDAAASELSALRDVEEASNVEIIRTLRRAESAKAVSNVRTDRLTAVSTRLEQAKASHRQAMAEAHAALGEAGVAGMLAACRQYDYCQAIF